MQPYEIVIAIEIKAVAVNRLPSTLELYWIVSLSKDHRGGRERARGNAYYRTFSIRKNRWQGQWQGK